MNAHVTEWLSAYYDGELPEDRQAQVEEHLSRCPACQAEFEGLHKLSQLLQEAPNPERVISGQTFQARVKLRLPPAIPQPDWQSTIKIGWQFAPLGAVILWASAQAVLALATLVLVLNPPPGLGRGIAPSGLASLASILSFSSVETAASLGLLNLGFTALVAVFLCGWLASWWASRRARQNDNPLLALSQISQQ